MNRRRLSLAVLSGLSVELLNKVAPLLILHLAQARLGLASFGFAMFGISFIELSLPFIIFGYHQLGAVAIARKREDVTYVGQMISNIVALRFIHALVVCCLVAAFLALYPPYQAYRQLIAALAFTYILSSIEVVWVHVAIQKTSFVNLVNGVSRFASLIAIYLFVESPEDGILFAVLNLLTGGLINVLTFASSLSQFPLRWPQWQGMRQTFSQAHSFALILFFTVFFERADIFIVEHALGMEGAGLYTGPARIGHALSQVAGAIVLAFFSEMIILQSREALTRHLRLGLWALTTFLAPIACGVWFVDKAIVAFVFGDAFVAVAPLLGLQCVSVMLSVASAALGMQILVVQGKAREFLWCLAAGALLALVFATLGVQLAGMYGVACGMGLAKLITLVILMRRVQPYVDHLPLTTCARAFVPALVMAGSLYLLGSSRFWVNLCVGGLVYVSLALFINRQQLSALIQYLSQRRSLP